MAEDIHDPAAVLFRELGTTSGYRVGVATLNAEKSLNALTLDMIRLLDARLRQWAGDPAIACVVIDSAGDRAFCAGGDVRFLRESILAQPRILPNPRAEIFFSEEYRLDYRIHTYPKPVLVWGGGIVMGGGLGLLAGASHRIVTETSRIAMPEITIGLYPDVGGSWFLQRMPGRSGLFLGLTGAPLNGHDALFVGLGDFLLRTTDREVLIGRLGTLAWTDSAHSNRVTLSRALRTFTQPAAASASNVLSHLEEIDRLTDGDSLAEIIARITSHAGGDGWLGKAATALAGGSPTSAALVWEMRRRTLHMSLADVFRLELAVSLQCCAHPDFAEGVRALLIDKDFRPRWTPGTLVEVTPQWLAEYFASPWSVWANQSNPLAALAA